MSTNVLVAMLVAAGTAACYSWRTEPPSPDAKVATVPARVARVTLLDGRRLEVADPTIANDTLRGWNLRDLRARGRRVPVLVPASQIQLVESRHLSPGKTTALALGVAAPIALMIGLASTCMGMVC